MSPGVQIVLSGMLTFGVPLLFAVRELIVLNRPSPDDRDRWRPEDVPPAPQPLGGGPSMRPLPDCLIPRPMSARPREVRVLELV